MDLSGEGWSPEEVRAGRTVFRVQVRLVPGDDGDGGKWEPQREVVLVGYERDGVAHTFAEIPYDWDAFSFAVWWLTNARYRATIGVLVGDEVRRVESEKVHKVDIQQFTERQLTWDAVGPVWCPVANMVRERPYGPGKRETKRGSIHFAPGAKLYCKRRIGWNRGPQLEVVGRHRGSHRYVTMIVSASWLTSWRVDLVYSPHVVRELWPLWDGTPVSKAEAEWFVQTYGSTEAV